MPDNWLELLGSSFVSLLLSLLLLRVWFPFGSRRSGSILYETRLSPLRRLLVLRGLLLLLTAYVALGQIERYVLGQGYYLPGTEYIALGGALLILGLPMRYVLTPTVGWRSITLRHASGASSAASILEAIRLS